MRELQAGLSSLGIQSDYGGAHSNRATEMAIVSFPDGSYLELIALQPNADPSAVALHRWASFMRANAGPCAWAIRSADVAAEAKHLRAAGLPVEAPTRGGRQRPDGVRLDWETAQVGDKGSEAFFPFLIRDFTPRERRVYPAGRPSAKQFTGVVKVIIAVKDLDAAATLYQQAYGLAPPIKQVDQNFGAHLAMLGGTPVVLAAPLSTQSWLTTRLEQFGEAPCAFVLGARRTGAQTRSKSRWFGKDIAWFDAEKLGWHLGVE